jgi:hypothetical protein
MVNSATWTASRFKWELQKKGPKPGNLSFLMKLAGRKLMSPCSASAEYPVSKYPVSQTTYLFGQHNGFDCLWQKCRR